MTDAIRTQITRAEQIIASGKPEKVALGGPNDYATPEMAGGALADALRAVLDKCDQMVATAGDQGAFVAKAIAQTFQQSIADALGVDLEG